MIGTVSSEAKVELAKQNGAQHVLLSSAPSSENVKKILEITSGLGVEVVYDGVGKDTWDENFEIIRRKGTIVTFGNASVSCADSWNGVRHKLTNRVPCQSLRPSSSPPSPSRSRDRRSSRSLPLKRRRLRLPRRSLRRTRRVDSR